MAVLSLIAWAALAPLASSADLEAPVREEVKLSRPASRGSGGTVKLIVFDHAGNALDLQGFLKLIGRADAKAPYDPAAAGIKVTSPEGAPAPAKPTLREENKIILLSWERLGQVQLSLPWPIEKDGFHTVWADKGGNGFVDGDAVYLNEEIAATQYRFFREALRKHTTEMSPLYKAGAKPRKLAEQARELLAKAHAEKSTAERAKAFDAAARATSIGWQKMLYEHGLQVANNPKTKDAARFGLTLDESVTGRVEHLKWLAGVIERSGAGWVRLVFKPNASDFVYGSLRSFNDYDGIVDELRQRNIRIMGCVLDTAQWPRGLTSEVYAERVKNLALHYREKIRSWEVGSELNGDWFGGGKDPMPSDQVFRIYSTGAAKLKELDPGFETVATLYWWDGTAPDDEHSTLGWLKRYSRQGFGRNLDVVGLSLQPDDNPVGMAFETIFEKVHAEIPAQKLLLSSLAYVEGKDLKGYYWYEKDDADAGRGDVLILYTAASCAMPNSLCGGYWWQALEQMIPGRKTTGLFQDFTKVLEQLGRD